MTQTATQIVERQIVKELVTRMLAADYVPVKVYDGGEYVDTPTAELVEEAVFSVDESTVHFAPRANPEDWGRRGVQFVSGNGVDLISDNHCGDRQFSDIVDTMMDFTETLCP